MESILTSIKSFVGVTGEYGHFDPQLIMHINSVFMDLNQMGVGPDEYFTIEDETSVWTDFLPAGINLEAVKSYMGIRVRLLFDPPQNSSVLNAMKAEADKWEWRLNVAAETST